MPGLCRCQAFVSSRHGRGSLLRKAANTPAIFISGNTPHLPAVILFLYTDGERRRFHEDLQQGLPLLCTNTAHPSRCRECLGSLGQIRQSRRVLRVPEDAVAGHYKPVELSFQPYTTARCRQAPADRSCGVMPGVLLRASPRAPPALPSSASPNARPRRTVPE